MPADKVQGSVYDCALSLSSQAGAVGFRSGVLFSRANGVHSVASTGSLIQTLDNPAVAYGLDFRGATFAGASIAVPGFTVDQASNVYHHP